MIKRECSVYDEHSVTEESVCKLCWCERASQDLCSCWDAAVVHRRLMMTRSWRPVLMSVLCHVSTLSWRPGPGRRFWFCRAGSYTSFSSFSTSRRGSTDLRSHTSRLRSALDSVWKAATRLKAEETSSPPAVQCYALLHTVN